MKKIIFLAVFAVVSQMLFALPPATVKNGWVWMSFIKLDKSDVDMDIIETQPKMKVNNTNSGSATLSGASLYLQQGKKVHFEINALVKNNGKVCFSLRPLITVNKKNNPCWIEFEKIMLNDTSISSRPEQTQQNKMFTKNAMQVSNGDEIKVSGYIQIPSPERIQKLNDIMTKNLLKNKAQKATK